MLLTTYTLEEVTEKNFDDSYGKDDLLDLVPDCDVTVNKIPKHLSLLTLLLRMRLRVIMQITKLKLFRVNEVVLIWMPTK